ncbi:MAG: hypothetical protein K2Z80_26945 [Xanthobacteraceae bacterium]|nr:hypothetical protein [Xanthobacteraceae bacterium]
MSVVNPCRRSAIVAASASATLLAWATTLVPSIGFAQPAADISVAGGPNTQRIVAIPRQGRKAVVLSLQGSVTWTNSQGSSSGFLKYRWGVLDDSGRFLPTASETPDRVQLAPTDEGFSELTVDRSILFAGQPNSASNDEDILAAIRIEECGFVSPIPDAQARCMFSGTVKAQQVQ